MFVKHSGGRNITVIIVYVDNIVLTGNNEEILGRVKILLAKRFEMKDLGHLKYFLEMKVARSALEISIFFRKYVLRPLEENM